MLEAPTAEDWQRNIDGWSVLGELADMMLQDMGPNDPNRAGVEAVRRGIASMMAAFDEQADA